LAAVMWRSAGGDLGGAVTVTVCAVLAGLLPWLWPARGGRRARIEELARHLDRSRPELEESALLLLADPATLAPLERLQRGRALAAAGGLPRAGVLPWRRPLGAAGVGALCALLALALRAAMPSPGQRASFVPRGSAAGPAAL